MRTEVASAVIVKDGRVLLTQRDPKRGAFGWCFESPGGKVESDDRDIYAALTREIEEELGVKCTTDLDVLATFILDPPVVEHPLQVTFIQAWITGDPCPLQAIGIAWLNAKELVGLELTPANKLLLPELLRLLQRSTRPEGGHHGPDKDDS